MLIAVCGLAPAATCAGGERAWHGLAERDAVDEIGLGQPAPPLDQVPLHVADRGDRPAEPPGAQAEEVPQIGTEADGAGGCGSIAFSVVPGRLWAGTLGSIGWADGFGGIGGRAG